jgi:hypothetical protein
MPSREVRDNSSQAKESIFIISGSACSTGGVHSQAWSTPGIGIGSKSGRGAFLFTSPVCTRVDRGVAGAFAKSWVALRLPAHSQDDRARGGGGPCVVRDRHQRSTRAIRPPPTRRRGAGAVAQPPRACAYSIWMALELRSRKVRRVLAWSRRGSLAKIAKLGPETAPPYNAVLATVPYRLSGSLASYNRRVRVAGVQVCPDKRLLGAQGTSAASLNRVSCISYE